jgi:hypothetical protein
VTELKIIPRISNAKSLYDETSCESKSIIFFDTVFVCLGMGHGRETRPTQLRKIPLFPVLIRCLVLIRSIWREPPERESLTETHAEGTSA